MMLPPILRNVLNSITNWVRILKRSSSPVLSTGSQVRLFNSRSWKMIWKKETLRTKMTRKKTRMMRITMRMSLTMM